MIKENDILVRVDPVFKKIVQSKCAEDGTSVSSYIRELIEKDVGFKNRKSLMYLEDLFNKKNPKDSIKILYQHGLYIYYEAEFGLCRRLVVSFDRYNTHNKAYINKQEWFINKSNKVHNFKYKYEKAKYVKNDQKVTIVCPIHGEFIQEANAHLRGSGCERCGQIEAKKKVNTASSHWTLKEWMNSGHTSKNFDSFKVYIIKCWNNEEEFYKIGRTFQKVERRFHNKHGMPYNYEVLSIYEGPSKVVYSLEILLKRMNEHNRYNPKIIFGGKFECYKKINIMDINEIKKLEIEELYDFWQGLQDYGHIYHYPPEKLDEPFKKIMEGINEVQELMNDSYSM